MLAGEDVPELTRLLLKPGDGLRVGDLALSIRYLPDERGVLGGERVHLGIEAAALGNLTVHGECNQSADAGDEHDRNPAQRDGTVERRTVSGTEDAILSPALCETNGTMRRRVSA